MILRSLILFGIVALFVVLGGDLAWAADDAYLRAPLEAGNGVFPYLSPVYEQRNILLNSFSFQMSLFGAMNGTGGGADDNTATSALHYLSITAVLVGTLLVVFNAKFRRVAVLGPWIIVVIITVFAPYGSKLLFYPIVQSGNVTAGINGQTSVASSDDCSETPQTCGFTPQLAALHVASVLQLVLSDLFNSQDWKTLIDETLAKQSLSNSPKMVASPEWPEKISDFANSCSNYNFDDLMSHRLGLSGGAQAQPDKFVMTSLAEQWAKMTRPYLNPAQVGEYTYPPQAIVLYDESTYPQAAPPEGWGGPENAGNYAKGITEIYRAFDSNAKPVSYGGSDGAITLAEALDKLEQDYSFFEPEVCKLKIAGIDLGFCQINTGIFFVRAGKPEKSLEYRNHYYASTLGQKAVLGAGNKNAVAQRRALQEVLSDTTGEVASEAKWGKLFKTNFMNSDWAKEMPVGVMNFAIGNPTASGPATIVPGVNGDENNGEPVRSCLHEGNRLLDEGINWTLGVNGKAKQLEKLREILINKTAIEGPTEAGKKTLELEDIYDPEVPCGNSAAAMGPGGSQAADGGCIYPSDLPLANAILNAFEVAQRNQASKLGRELEPKERNAVLLKLIIDSMDGSTGMFRQKSPVNPDELKSAELQSGVDATRVSNVGIGWLSSTGGWAGVLFGGFVANVGAWLTGPLSTAIVYFISLLVDMALMTLIILTPILFLIALVIPSTAMGVLTISIMGAFILKAVPITLLVLNNVGAMIYNMIDVGGGEAANTMQSLMLLAMAGLYANVVGMTFFLLFKMGDPATVLGRFTALDGAGKNVAERGMALAATVATTAALAVAGGIGAGLGRVGAGGVVAKAAQRLGVSKDVTDAAGAVATAGAKGQQESDQPPPKPGDADFIGPVSPDGDNGGGDGTAGVILESLGDGLTEDGDANARAFFGSRNAAQNIEELKAKGYTGEEINTFAATGSATKLDPITGQPVKSTFIGDQIVDSPGDMADISTQQQAAESRAEALGQTGVTPLKPGGDLADEAEAIAGTASEQIVKTEAGQRVETTRQQIDQQQIQQREQGDQQSKQPTLSENATMEQIQQQQNIIRGGEGDTAEQIPADSAAGGTQPGVAGAGQVMQVNVVGGTLSNVGEVGKIPAQVSQGDMAARTEEIEKQKTAEQLADDVVLAKQVANNEGLDEDVRKVAQDFVDKASKATTIEDAQEAIAERDRQLGAKGTSVAELTKFEQAQRNLNDQLAGERSKARIELADPKTSDSRKQHLESYLARLNEIKDPARITQAALYDELTNFEELKGAMNALGAADKQPGGFQTVVSGVYGAMAGAGGGLSKIPILGPALGEVANEYYQAPERARAWNAAGGVGKWYKAQGDAKRLGFYQKEMAPLGAGEQYQAMAQKGAFQVQADLARQTANEAVAKSRSQFEAMIESAKNMPANTNIEVGSVNFRSYMNASELAGLGRMEAIDRIASVRQEAWTMQGQSIVTPRAVLVDENGKPKIKNGQFESAIDPKTMQFKVDPATGEVLKHKIENVNVKPTVEMLARVRGDLVQKRVNNSIDEMLIGHYGLVEKGYLRGSVEWNRMRDATRTAAGAQASARAEVSTDYVIGGHLKMVEGKEGYKKRQGAYERLLDFRDDENMLKARYLREQIASRGYDKVVKDSGFNASSLNNYTAKELKVAEREALDKYARDKLKSMNVNLKLESIFDHAHAKGDTVYQIEALVAPYRTGAMKASISEAVMKEIKNSIESIDGFNEQAEKKTMLNVGGQRSTMDEFAVSITKQFKSLHKGGEEEVINFVENLKSAIAHDPRSVQVNKYRVEGAANGMADKFVEAQHANTIMSQEAGDKLLSMYRDEQHKNVREILQQVLKSRGTGEGYLIDSLTLDTNGREYRGLDLKNPAPPKKSRE